MKKICVRRDIVVPGWGLIPAGSAFRVDRYNSRYVYVKLAEGVVLRLARKSDCEKIY